METNKRTIGQVIAAIQALDLERIKINLMDMEEGHGWSRQYADKNEREYKRFLTLVVKYPDQMLAPSNDVGKFWHSHILNTLKYTEDCENVFGYFLHHAPYFGMYGGEDAVSLAKAEVNTVRLYEQEFGQSEHIEAGF